MSRKALLVPLELCNMGLVVLGYNLAGFELGAVHFILGYALFSGLSKALLLGAVTEIEETGDE